MLIWTWCRFVIFSLRLNCYSYNFTGKNRIGFFFYIHVRISYFFPKSSHISWNNTMDTHRCLSMQCNIIALDYLFNGFSTIPTYYFQFFFKTTKKVKRTRAVTHHFIHLPQLFVSICLILCSYIRFEMDFNGWGKLKVKIEFREKKKSILMKLDSFWREWSY